MSIGNSVLNLMYGNPLTGLAGGPRALPGNMNPAPGATGAPGMPSGGPQPAPQPGTSQTPSPATQSPPDLAQLYVQLAQRQQSANAIDRGLTMMAAANASPNMSRSLMASMPQQGAGVGGMDIKSLMELQMMQQMYANRPAMISALSGGDQQKAAILGLMPPQQLQEIAGQQIQAGTQIQTQKQEQINKDVQEHKNDAIADFTPADQKLRETEAGVNQLLNDMPSTMQALAAPDLLTTSKVASWLPFGYSDAVKQQAVAKEKLEAALSAEALSGMKNVRNQREFNTIGESLTAGLNPNNGPQGVQQALQSIQQRLSALHANVYAAAGKEIPNQYSGMADPSYTSQTNQDGTPNPYFTGATYEKPPTQTAQGGGGGQPVQISGPGDIAKLPRGTPFIIPSGPNQGKIGYAQ